MNKYFTPQIPESDCNYFQTLYLRLKQEAYKMRNGIANKKKKRIKLLEKKKKKEIGCKEDANLLPQTINSIQPSNLPTCLHLASLR